MLRIGALVMLLSSAAAVRLTAESVSKACSVVVEGSDRRSSAWRRTNDCKCEEYFEIAGEDAVCKDYLGKRYFPSSLTPGVCKCQQVSDQRCSSIVAGSITRESAGYFESNDCKCLNGWAVGAVGEPTAWLECAEFLGQRYFPDTLKPGNCKCEPVCASGAFLSVTKQPTLGLAHMPLGADAEDVPFARYSDGKCSVDFLLDCDEGFPTVQTEVNCPDGEEPSSRITKSRGGAVIEKWEVCNDEGGELTLLSPVIDQLWDTQMASGTLVEGCVQIESARKWKELQAVRGSLEEQTQALIDRKQDVGGCPQFRNAEDRVTRANDFPGSWWLRQIQDWQSDRAVKLAKGTEFWEKTSNLFMLVWLATGTGGNRTIAFNQLAGLNCMQVNPFAAGIAKWSHAEVAAVASAPNQGRKYVTATVPQTASCFDPTLALFLSSGSPEHTQFRLLLDEAGFDSLLEVDLPAPTFPGGPPKAGAAAPSEMDVGGAVLPMVLKGVWQQEASQDVVDELLPYLEVGKTCIFGTVAEDLGLVKSSKVVEIRKAHADFGKDTPRGKKLISLLELEKYQAVKTQYKSSGQDPAKLLMNNLGTGVLFAGLLGTTHMAYNCVNFQFRDRAHVGMFRKDKKAYLHELMRFDGAVTSYTATLTEPEFRILEGHPTKLKAGTAVQMTLATSNRDPQAFKDPNTFNPQRSDLDEQLSWNGRLKDVMARDYAKAPRFCPGYHLSVKVAMDVCDYFTRNLEE